LKEKVFALVIALTTALILPIQLLHASQDFVPARVRDISDRMYEQAVISLLDGAKESIYVSMFNISMTENQKDPVKFLLRDLLEALERGVEVTLNLNTRALQGQDMKGTEKLIGSPIFEELKKAGCKIHLMSPFRRLHDKLIIVDSRYVVEGSTNWSTSALKTNLESATLIDSPELARVKLARLEALMREPAHSEEGPRKAQYLENLPAEIAVSYELLSKRYLPRMVTKKDRRGLGLYLLLLAQSQAMKVNEFFIDLEDMGLSLGIPDTWEDSKIRQHVILPLRRLMDEYKLISAEFYRDKDAWIEMKEIPGKWFMAPSSLARPDKDMSLSAKFLMIVKSSLEVQGEDMASMSGREIARRFYLSHTTVNEGLKELRERGIIERE